MPVPSDDLATQGWDVCGGGDAIVARNRHALMPMGPGDKRRDDSCAYGAVEMTLAAIPRLDPAGSFIRRRKGCMNVVSRSEERGVGKEGCRKCRSGWWRSDKKKK